MTTPDFNRYCADLIAEGKRQLVIRNSNALAWNSELSTYLLNKFECRQISFEPDSSDFVAYLLKPIKVIKPIIKETA